MKTLLLPLVFLLSTPCCVVGQSHEKDAAPDLTQPTDARPTFFIAAGLNKDGSLEKYYRRGLDYAINYFGNYGPYSIFLLAPGSEENIRDIYRKRAATRANPNAGESVKEQIEAFLKQPNMAEEIEAVLKGEVTGGLTWSDPERRVYEDVTTDATERERDPVENTWGALHEYHHVFQVSQVDSYAERDGEKNFSSWMAEGMATYSAAKFMENLGLVDFKDYMLQLRTSGANIGRPGINEYLENNETFRLDDERYWKEGNEAQVYYMLGAWATAYLIQMKRIDEKTVLKEWYFDILKFGKSAAFKKHMGISLEQFYAEFDTFIRQSDDEAMKIFADRTNE